MISMSCVALVPDAADKPPKALLNVTKDTESPDCYIYTTGKYDTLEWLTGRRGLKLLDFVIDNAAALKDLDQIDPGLKS